jgi:propanediol dehydratase small subunit
VPDLVGGLDEADPPGVGATAARAEGLVAALGAARRLGREEAAARYERALDLAAVYVLQNQFRPQNSYQLLRPERARGGFRLNVLAGELRPETAAHAAAFLLEYAGLKAPGRK